MHEASDNARTERLDYMQSMLGQLRLMAEAERCNMVAYLVGMAYIEVSDVIRGDRPARLDRPDDVSPLPEKERDGAA